MAIPRLIHQTFPSKVLPPELAANVEQLRRDNPDWTHTLYDDADIEAFIRSEFKPIYLQAYQRINPRYGAARADFFRYLVVYRRGGIYLDIKSTAVRPLTEVVSPLDRYVLAYWPNRRDRRFVDWGQKPELAHLPRGELQNWHVIAEPSHAFLQQTIERVVHNILHYDMARAGVGRNGVLRTTGPIAYTQAVVPLLASYPHRLAGTHVELGLQYITTEAEGNVLSHLRHFGTHYSMLRDPVVLAAPSDAAEKSSETPVA